MMISRMPLAATGVTVSLVVAAPSLAADVVRDMDRTRLGDVADALGLRPRDFIAAVEIDADLESLRMDDSPWSAAADLSGRIEQEIERLVTEGDLADSADLAGRAVALDINEPWQHPFGLEWLVLNGATVVGQYAADGTLGLSIVGVSESGGVPMTTRVSFVVNENGETIEVGTSINELTLGQIGDLLSLSGLPAPFTGDIAGEALTFRDVEIAATFSETFDFTMTGTTVLMDTIEADAMFTYVTSHDDEPQVILGLRMHEWTLAELHHGLYGTVAAEVEFPAVAFSIAREVGTIESMELSAPAFEFYRPVLGDSFSLDLHPGITFDGALPLNRLPSELVSAMGMNRRDSITVEGSLDLAVHLLGRGSSIGVDGFTLEASLPPVQDMRLPQALRSMFTVERVLRLAYADDAFSMGVANTVRTEIDGATRTFDLTADVQSRGDEQSGRLSGSMRGSWEQPFGLDWLTLDDVRLQTRFSEEGIRTVLESSFDVAGKEMGIRVVIDQDDRNQRRISLRGTIDEFSTGEIRQLLARIFPNAVIFEGEGFIDVPFRDVAMTIEVGETKAFSIRAETSIRGQDAEVMISAIRAGSSNEIIAGFRLDEFGLADALPALEGTLIDEMDVRFPGANVVFASGDLAINADMLSDEALRFYRGSTAQEGGESADRDFDLDLRAGLNLVGSIRLPEGEITSMLSSIGLTPGGELPVTGTLPTNFLSGGVSGVLSDLSLRVALPAMRPAGAPEWFVSGQLALEITGRPSVGLVGEMTVDLEGDVLTFFVAGTVARDGVGVALALTGGLSADEPWVSPFGLNWLAFNEARIKLSMNAAGNLGLGFAGDMVIGDKDIDTAVFVAVNMYTGVPTNFIFEGESAAGVSLSDLVCLQYRMMTLTAPFAPELPIDRLPDVALRNIHVKFAPKDDADLGVERGFIVQGECWARPTPFGQMTFIGRVHLSIDENGIVGSGETAAFDLGPIQMDEANASLELTLGRQELSVSGLARIGSRHVGGTVELTRDGLDGELLGKALDHARAAVEAAREAARRVIAALTAVRWW
jgi:hypothetical protein